MLNTCKHSRRTEEINIKIALDEEMKSHGNDLNNCFLSTKVAIDCLDLFLSFRSHSNN